MSFLLSLSFFSFVSMTQPVFRVRVNKLFQTPFTQLHNHTVNTHTSCHSSTVLPSLSSFFVTSSSVFLLPPLLPALIFVSPASIFSCFLSVFSIARPSTLLHLPAFCHLRGLKERDIFNLFMWEGMWWEMLIFSQIRCLQNLLINDN